MSAPTHVGGWIFGLVLVDVPVFVVVVVVGLRHGFAATYSDVVAWRLAHPWSFVPSAVAAGVVVRKVVHQRKGDRSCG